VNNEDDYTWTAAAFTPEENEYIAQKANEDQDDTDLWGDADAVDALARREANRVAGDASTPEWHTARTSAELALNARLEPFYKRRMFRIQMKSLLEVLPGADPADVARLKQALDEWQAVPD